MSDHARVAAAGAALALGVVGAVALAAPAHAADIECGAVITTSVALTHDLACDGSTDAIVIGANGVTLDLKGFTISGPGAYATPRAGVRAAQRTGVTVTNGTITGFQSAVVLDESWDGTVSKVVASANDQGINLAGGGRHVVVKNTSTGNGRDAIKLGLSTQNLVSQNVISDNVFGIFVTAFSSDNVVERNVVTGTRGPGLAAFGGSTGTTFAQNTVTGGSDDGIRVASDTANSLVLQNAASSNSGDGIEAASSTTITKNTATFNGQLGIRALAGTIDGGGNKAASNGDPAQCVGVTCTAP